MKIAIRRLPHGGELPLPAYASEGASGMDLLAAVASDVSIAPGTYTVIPTGVALSIPNGYEAQVRPRSGLALKHGVTVLNAPGTIDSDYRGEVKVILINHGTIPFVVSRGMRIAQLIVSAHARVEWSETPDLVETARGAGGFGSTGL